MTWDIRITGPNHVNGHLSVNSDDEQTIASEVTGFIRKAIAATAETHEAEKGAPAAIQPRKQAKGGR